MALLEHEKEMVPAVVGNSASFHDGVGGGQLIYQLVRVEEDGTVVPASEDEVIEMGSYLEEGVAVGAEGTQLNITDEEAAVCEQEDSNHSKKANAIGPQDLDSIEAERTKILAQLAFLDALLQKLKNEEQERASLEAAEHVASYSKVTRSRSLSKQGTLTSTERWDSKSETNNVSSEFSDDYGQKQDTVLQQKFDGNQFKLRELESPSSTSKHNWTSTSSESLFKENSAQIHSTEDKRETSRDSDGDGFKRHSSLDKLSIRELHETYETTFGRQTSVKDKQWLKRRISLGLAGSREVTSTEDGLDENPKFPLTEGVHGYVKARQAVEIRAPNVNAVLLDSESLYNNKCPHEILSEETASGSSPGRPWVPDRLITGKDSECPGKTDKVQDCREEGKRKRKPTKRYIEELTASEPRDVSGKANCTKEEKEDSPLTSGMHLKELSISGISKVKLKTGYRKRCYHPNKNSSKRLISSSTKKAAKLVRKAISLRISRASQNAALDEPRERVQTLPSDLLDDASDLSVLSSSHDGEPISNFSKFSSSKCDADAILMQKAKLPKKHHHPWTLREVMKLLEGVTHCGVGKWADIKKYSFSNCSSRSSTDLKDKWRNLVRASNAHFKMGAQGERHPRKHSVSPVPGTILMQVRELTKGPSLGNAVSAMSRSGRSVSRKHFI